MAEFHCKACGKDFEVEWRYDQFTTCPHCQTEYGVEWDESWDGEEEYLHGPWLVDLPEPKSDLQ